MLFDTLVKLGLTVGILCRGNNVDRDTSDCVRLFHTLIM